MGSYNQPKPWADAPWEKVDRRPKEGTRECLPCRRERSSKKVS